MLFARCLVPAIAPVHSSFRFCSAHLTITLAHFHKRMDAVVELSCDRLFLQFFSADAGPQGDAVGI